MKNPWTLCYFKNSSGTKYCYVTLGHAIYGDSVTLGHAIDGYSVTLVHVTLGDSVTLSHAI